MSAPESIPNMKGVKIGNQSNTLPNANAPQTRQAPSQQRTSRLPSQPKSEATVIMETAAKSAARSFGTRIISTIMNAIFKTKR